MINKIRAMHEFLAVVQYVPGFCYLIFIVNSVFRSENQTNPIVYVLISL